jgi:hypothetical protein
MSCSMTARDRSQYGARRGAEYHADGKLREA